MLYYFWSGVLLLIASIGIVADIATPNEVQRVLLASTIFALYGVGTQLYTIHQTLKDDE